MHIDLAKHLFIGTSKNKSAFFKDVQKLGCVQFLAKNRSLATTVQEQTTLYIQAIKILRHYSNLSENEGEVEHPYDFCKTVLALENRKETLTAYVKQLSLQLGELAPLGKIPFHELLTLSSSSSLVPRLWIAPSSKRADTLSSDLLFLTQDGSKDYFISFKQEMTHIQGLREILLDDKTQKIQEEHAKTLQEIASVELELKQRAGWLHSLQKAFVHMMNTTRREMCENGSQAPLEDHLFAIQGWIPVIKQETVRTLCNQHAVLMETIAPAKDEPTPTYLENKGFARIGEDLVQIYDTPSYKDTDPSLWVLGFFAFFFAFIVNDAGYGIVFFLASLYLFFRKKKTPPSKQTHRFVKLLALLGISCIAWGCCTQSFFGTEIEPTNPLHSLSVVDPLLKMHAQYHMDQEDAFWQLWLEKHPNEKDPSLDEFLNSPSSTGAAFAEVFKGHLMFEIALLIGLLHICLSMCRYLFRHPAYAGWILFMIGGYLFAPKLLNIGSLTQHLFHADQEICAFYGKQLMILGFSIALLFSMIRHGIVGILETCTAPIQIFGDVLSYLRLYALSMAGAIVAALINRLGVGAPPVIAWILIPICHAGNMLLGTVGGVIHGLRLNFLEWYHYSFIGGGKPFSPLTLDTFDS